MKSIHDGVNLTGKDPTELEVKIFKCNVCNVTKSTKIAMIKHKVITHKDTETNRNKPKMPFNRSDTTEEKPTNEPESKYISTGKVNTTEIKDNNPKNNTTNSVRDPNEDTDEGAATHQSEDPVTRNEDNSGNHTPTCHNEPTTGEVLSSTQTGGKGGQTNTYDTPERNSKDGPEDPQPELNLSLIHI